MRKPLHHWLHARVIVRRDLDGEMLGLDPEDKVWVRQGEFGEVVEVDLNSDIFPLLVKFENGDEWWAEPEWVEAI